MTDLAHTGRAASTINAMVAAVAVAHRTAGHGHHQIGGVGLVAEAARIVPLVQDERHLIVDGSDEVVRRDRHDRERALLDAHLTIVPRGPGPVFAFSDGLA